MGVSFHDHVINPKIVFHNHVRAKNVFHDHVIYFSKVFHDFTRLNTQFYDPVKTKKKVFHVSGNLGIGTPLNLLLYH